MGQIIDMLENQQWNEKVTPLVDSLRPARFMHPAITRVIAESENLSAIIAQVDDKLFKWVKVWGWEKGFIRDQNPIIFSICPD